MESSKTIYLVAFVVILAVGEREWRSTVSYIRVVDCCTLLGWQISLLIVLCLYLNGRENHDWGQTCGILRKSLNVVPG